MIKVEIVTVDGKKGAKVEMFGNPIECTSEAISIVAGLYGALKQYPGSEIFADAFCDALHENVFKGDEELEKATRKAEEQIGEKLKEATGKVKEQATDEANDFLRKFVDALKR